MNARAIDTDSTVTLQFALSLPDGKLIDGNLDGAPATFRMGDGTLLPGFEAVLVGLAPGDEREFAIPAERAFGVPRDDNIQRIPRYRFAGMSLEKGAVVSFADAARVEVPGIVQALEGDTVVVDFNHPLAGRELMFTVKIHEVA